MVVATKSATVIGLNVYEINIEVDTINSIPQVAIIGLPDTAISEAKEEPTIEIIAKPLITTASSLTITKEDNIPV